MELQQPARNEKRSRHRIREITLHPPTCSYDIDVEIHVDGAKIHTLKRIEKRNILSWKELCLPCNVHETSTITIQITEIRTLRDKTESHVYQVSQAAGQDVLSIGHESGRFTVKVELLTGDEAERAYQDALNKAQQMNTQPSVVAKLGRVGGVFRGLLGLGSAVAEVDPTGGAKVAFALCIKAWEHLEAQEKLEADLKQFIESLSDVVPSIEDVKPLADVHLADTVQRTIELIEDVSLFVLSYKSRNTFVRIMSSALDSETQEQMQVFSARFERLRKEFDTRVAVQTLGAVQAVKVVETEALSLALLSKLQPVNLASYDLTRACMTGTRLGVIHDVTTWILDSNAKQRFTWIYGLAGLGKSSVATSVCDLLDRRHCLGTSFFCKRDSPELRDPCRVITTIAYSLAMRWKAYGNAVIGVLDSEPELHTRHIQPQYEALLAKPLRGLAMTKHPANDLLIVVDALDECGDAGSRRQLLACLRDMSQIAPWLKVMVTSRPDVDIQEYFARGEADWFTSYNLLDYDAGVDIRTFVTEELSNLAHVEGWPKEVIDQLSDMSSGLFVWARTACKYITNGHNPRKRLDRVLSRTHGDDSASQLDSLYATAVKAGALDDDEDNLADILEFLGVIVATATRTPLSIPDMSRLLRGRISEYSLEHMLGSLTSVLYRDPKQGYAVRVSHPSFMDYITDKQRSKQLCIELDVQNAMLAKCCLETMLSELRFNLCDLDTSGALNKDVPDLDERARERISPHLRYSCIYWTSYLVRAGGNEHNLSLQMFMYERTVLYWIEAMSLLHMLHVALSNLLELSNALSTTEEYRLYARDVYRFVLAFYDAICASTPHLYISALPLAPSNSLLAQRMQPHFPNIYTVTQGAESDWTPCIRTIGIGSMVSSVAWSSDGRLIATSSNDDTVQVWDAETGAPLLKPIYGHSNWVMAVAFSPDSRRIVSGSMDKTVRVWDVETGAAMLEPLHGHSAAVLCAAFSPDNSLIVSGSEDKTVRVWDTTTCTARFILDSHSKFVHTVTFSPDGHRIASGSDDGSIRMWDVETAAELFRPFASRLGTVYSLKFSSDGGRIVSGSSDETIRIWDTATGNSLAESQGKCKEVLSVVFSRDNKTVISGSQDGTVRRWDAETGAPVSGPLLGHSAAVSSIALSPDGRRIVSGSWDKTVRIWDAEASKKGSEIPQGHSSWVRCVASSPDGRQIASCSNDETIRIWDAKSGAAVLGPICGHSDYVVSVAYSPDGRRIASGSSDKTVRIWDAKTGATLLEPLQGHLGKVNSVIFSPDSKCIVSGSDDSTVRLWEVSTGTCLLRPFQGHSGSIYSVTFSHDGRFLASGSKDQTVRLWNVETGMAALEPLHGHSAGVRSVAFSPNNKLLASGSDDGRNLIWDAAAGTLLFELSPEPAGLVLSVSFSLNSLLLLSFFTNGTIHIWDIETGALAYEPLAGHYPPSFSVLGSACFLPDGHHIVSGFEDSTVRIWNLTMCAKVSSQFGRLLPDTHIKLIPGGDNTALLSTSSLLARHVDSNGWVRTSDGGLYVWLPPDLRSVDDSSICISRTPPRARAIMDFSNHVHGREWQSVTNI